MINIDWSGKAVAIIGAAASLTGFLVGLWFIGKDPVLILVILAGLAFVFFSGQLLLRIRRNVQRFKKISCEDFFSHLDPDEITAIDIFGHTGANIIQSLLHQLEHDREVKKKFQGIGIRILLRSPGSEIGKRAVRIEDFSKRIRELREEGFTRLSLNYYENLPTFRAVVCSRKTPHENHRFGYFSFYYFPFNSISKTYPRALVIDEKQTGRHDLIDIVGSWFEYYWAKNREQVRPLHTLILDFDDTIVNSHGFQIDAWVDLIKESNLDKCYFTEAFRDIRGNENSDELRGLVSRIFFQQQDAKKILPEIFSGLDENKINELHQRRFELRVKRMRRTGAEILFPHFLENVTVLAKRYNLIIVSATDETEIINYLKGITFESGPYPYKQPYKKLLHCFHYVFGKREPIFDWSNMKRKSQLIIKIINILGVPIERMLYIGDNNGDFRSARDIGLKFVEARLFEDELVRTTGKDTLISGNKPRPVLRDWNDLTEILDAIESGM